MNLFELIGSIFTRRNSSSKSSLVSERGNYALWFLFILTLIGALAIFLYSFRHIDIKGQLGTNQSLVICIGLLIAGTAYALGAFGGFLFGIPKSISNSTTPVVGYIDNDNLVQISDWLTKIIVGVGLTQLIKVPKYLESLGNYLKESWGGDATASISTVSLALYFLICGFLMSYLWTRLYFKQMLNQADLDSKRILQQKETDLNAIIDPYTDSVNSNDPNAFKTLESKQTDMKEKLEKSGTTLPVIPRVLSFTDYSALLDKAKQKMKNGLIAQGSIPDELKDPNKNQWGGKAENNDRKISAAINPIDDKGLYRVSLTVESTNKDKPLIEGDTVLFSLHNSFPDPYKFVNINNGTAKLEIVSYGSFTVGACVNNDKTELELDLSQIPNTPSDFKEN